MVAEFEPFVSESAVAFKSNEVQWIDRVRFVSNLGVLLSQTREGIVGAYLDDRELVHVVYKGGHEELINVRLDSYIAIISDVAKNL